MLSTSESTIAFLRVGEYIQCDCIYEQPIDYCYNDDNNDVDEEKLTILNMNDTPIIQPNNSVENVSNQ
jgi:hypothetical protein